MRFVRRIADRFSGRVSETPDASKELWALRGDFGDILGSTRFGPNPALYFDGNRWTDFEYQGRIQGEELTIAVCESMIRRVFKELFHSDIFFWKVMRR